MSVSHIPYEQTGYFSKTMIDYLAQADTLKPFYHRFPSLDGFKDQIAEKKEVFTKASRTTLVQALNNQYKGVEASEATSANLQSLGQENTFTVTTGHQLNLFTGPLYFLYKIISVLNLCENLKAAYPTQHFVPVYWMASEDHDFDEINYFNFKGSKIQWTANDGGPVGRMSTEGLEEVLAVFSSFLGTSKNASYLKTLFEKGYLEHKNLAAATRYIANALFGAYGLVIVDGDDAALKRQFIPYAEEELLHQTSFTQVTATNTQLSEAYKIQVNPREINLFYILDHLRERIVFNEQSHRFEVHNTEIGFSKEALLTELHTHPERFSPNALLRPLYQEVILPNLAYIGGGGELAYWLQLKSYFNAVKVPFPMLLLRNSAVLVSAKQEQKIKALGLTLEDLFKVQHTLLAEKVLENTEVRIDFSQQKAFLEAQFNTLRAQAAQTDVSFIGAVNAQERKQIKGLLNLEKRLIKAEKRKQEDLVTRITALQNDLFPHQSLEERQRNFAEFYVDYGPELIRQLKESLQPLLVQFSIIILK